MRILPYSPELAVHFDRINRQWIESMFSLEPVDENVIGDPQTYVINQGGYIWFAEADSGEIVGTCALMKKEEGVFELTKMGVSEHARGMKAGEKLLVHVLSQAQHIATDNLFLLTNSKCQAAIHLYEKLGFVHDAATMAKYGQAYERCNVAMKLSRLNGN